MYSFLLCIQIIDVSIALFFTLYLLRLKGSLDNKLLFFSAICADLYAIGYVQELLSTDETGIRAALNLQYVGLAYAALCFAMFIMRYCHVKIPKLVQSIMIAYCTFILIAVQMGNRTSIYYTSFEVVDTGFFPHMVASHGFLYNSFVAFQVGMMLLSMYELIRYRSKVKGIKERKRLLFLLIETIICIVGLFSNVALELGGWDPGSLMISFLVVSMTITLERGHFYDTINSAMESMFQDVGSAVIIADASKNYLESNKTACELFPEIKNWEMGHDMSNFGTDFFASAEPFDFEKEERYYRSSYIELFEKNNLIGYTITVNDITDVRKQAEDMKKLKEEADIANKAKSAFLANMSHEIRTPLNAIIGMAEISEREKSESVIKEYVAQIKSAGQMLLGIVSDVLDFSKAESGRLELVPVEFNTAELLNSVINVTNMRIGDKPVDFVVDIDPNIPTKLYGDDVHLKQIIMNLLSNAEKFTQRGQITLKLDFEKKGDNILLKGSVKDTGLGIKECDREKLFSAFRQVDERRNRRIEGSGLGLAIFAQLVTLMNGTYSVESEYGHGSTFSFVVTVGCLDFTPFAKAERTELKVAKVSAFALYGITAGNMAPVSDNDIPDYSKYSILVVDDNKVNIKVFAAFLKHFNVVADAAYSGMEALEMVKNKKYDLIFMDHMMPEMDGVDTTKAIRAMENDYCRSVPIVACTANVIKGVEDLFIEAGMNDFLPKPIQLSLLKDKMANYLK